MQDIRVKLTVRNNLLLSAIEYAGFSTQADFARYAGMTAQAVNDLVSMRLATITKNGTFCDAAKDVMEALGASPNDLWSDEQLTLKLDRNTSETRCSLRNLAAMFDKESPELPDVSAERKMLTRTVNRALLKLNEKERLVIRHRYYLDMTAEDVARTFDVSHGRIRQLEAAALKKLRSPKVSKILMGQA